MPREGELTYYESIGEEGRSHAMRKPFSEADRGVSFMQVGAVLALLPPPPARILECGCGCGWFTLLLQRCGYRATGVDVSPMAIDLCRGNTFYGTSDPPDFAVADSERLPYEGEFDAVLFFDSLHHCVDEQAAIDSAFRALKPGGVCVASETAHGHAERSADVSERFDVTEKDMPPRLIVRLGRKAGFRRTEIHPRADEIGKCLFAAPAAGITGRLRAFRPVRYLSAFVMMAFWKHNYGIAVLHK